MLERGGEGDSKIKLLFEVGFNRCDFVKYYYLVPQVDENIILTFIPN